MPRPLRELDPDGGPLVAFARDLRALREQAGSPKFAAMERRVGRSKSALAEAVAGRHLPRWETVADFVRACDGDPEHWRARWEALRAEPVADAPEPAPEPAPAPAPTGSDGAPTPARRRWVLLGAAASMLVLAALVGGFVVGRETASPEPAPDLRAIETQNKVAIGPDQLIEDRSPIYLSELPIARCAQPNRNCKVPGTEMGSGVGIVAHCTVRGQRLHNFNLREAAAATNPDRAASDLWYRASFPDGRSGYISEVYLTAGSRGGLGLPPCATGGDTEVRSTGG